jgi:hypothetical protein
VIGTRSLLRGLTPLWLWTWPLWTVVVFASLAAVRPLPGGYARAAITAPILFMVPGSLTLGAIFSQRSRPRGAAFICYAALLGAAWSAFASLALYASGVSITAANTYGCLLIVSTVLAIVAESRLLFGRPGTGRRAARQAETLDPDLSEAEVSEAERPASTRWGGGVYYAVPAVVAGVSLLAGGLYAYDHLPHPAPVGYTWIAWTGPQIKGNIAVGSTGTSLHFQIVHHQSDTTAFRLSAAWLGNTSQPLAKPLTLSIGPDRTFQGAVFIPPLPTGCTYRIVVVLTAARQINPLTKKPQTWSINADVHDPHKSSKTCK